MRKSALAWMLLAAGLSLGACATNDYGYAGRDDGTLEGAATGAAVGAAVGAGVGAVVDGVDVGEGAAVGAIGGAIAGAVASDNNRRWYRDDRGYCYWVNNRGERIYDYDKRC